MTGYVAFGAARDCGDEPADAHVRQPSGRLAAEIRAAHDRHVALVAAGGGAPQPLPVPYVPGAVDGPEAAPEPAPRSAETPEAGPWDLADCFGFIP